MVAMRWLLGSGALLVAQPAFANDMDFVGCDGYEIPTSKSDGITTADLLWGLTSTSSEIRPRAGIPFGAPGVKACDGALANTLLKPEFAIRRISLTQAKALHQLVVGDNAGALVTLDLAASLPFPDGDRLRDLGFGITADALRSIALTRLDRKAEALAAVERIEKRRPWSMLVNALTLRLRSLIDPSVEGELDQVRRTAPIQPGSAIVGLTTAMAYGRMGQAAEFGRGLTIDVPVLRGGWSSSGLMSDYQLIETRARLAGAVAYALAASGKKDEARSKLDEIVLQTKLAMTAPPPPPPGKTLSKSAQADYDTRVKFGDRALQVIETWKRLVDLRDKAPTLDDAGLIAAIKNASPEAFLVSIDLLDRLPNGTPQVMADRKFARNTLTEANDEERRRAATIDWMEFLPLLPRPETLRNQGKFHPAGDGYFLSDNGFSSKRMDSDDKWTIRFTSALGTPASVDELALLSAAQFARKKGYGQFIVESRRNYERTTEMIGMYGGGRTNSGHESQLVIRLVRPGSLPTDLAGAEWRMLDADGIIAELGKQHPETLASASR